MKRESNILIKIKLILDIVPTPQVVFSVIFALEHTCIHIVDIHCCAAMSNSIICRQAEVGSPMQGST